MKKLFFTFVFAIGMIALAHAQLTVQITNNLNNDVACKVVENNGTGTPVAYYNQIIPNQTTTDVVNTWNWGLMCGVADLSGPCGSNGPGNIVTMPLLISSGTFPLPGGCGSVANWTCVNQGGGVFLLRISFD